jgi:hypothetical protein
MVKMEKYDKIWEKNVGKVGKICEDEKIIGKDTNGNDILRYQIMVKMKNDAKI